ncbi:ABC transporter ATP-binding protein [Ferrimonas balearica]|uniref:ABC transporter ATP-binding protein n=1 Tax=Ferrimonas balearica TaxID=44012 RepID=UPI001C956BC2|nr:ABC transporter ATP-binding protein [Ferrimonas balearica]MBY6105681.1 ABC transporter ATP-binding protein [Ferrimonas balearica]
MLFIDHLQLACHGLRLATPLELRLPEGQWLGLLGPNGCGKTTLLKTLAGLLPASQGGLWFADQSLLTMTPRERAHQLAIMVQHNAPCGGLTVEQVVALGKAPDRALDRTWLDQLLQLCGLRELRRAPLERLSGGQVQRTMLAQALFQDTPVMLLDEPANHLDIFHLHHLLSLLRKRSLTVIASFHDMNVAAQYCDQLLLLADGEQVACGTPEQVLTPAHLQQAYSVDAHVTTGIHGRPQVTVLGACDNRRNWI